MDNKINPPTIGKRPPSSIIYGLFIASLLFLLLPLTQLIDSATSDKGDRQVKGYVEPPPPMDMEMEAPEVEEEEVEIEEMEEPPPPPDLSALELMTNVDITQGFGVGSKAFDFSSQVGKELDEMIFTLKDVSKPPVPTYRREPVYPPELKRLKIEGQVFIDCVVDKNGNVRNPKVHKSDNDGFNKNAIDAVRKWKFTPGEKDGKKVLVKVRIPINFNLK
jgi:protein TonB